MLIPRHSHYLPLEIRKDFDFTHGLTQSISGVTIVIPVRGLERQKNLDYCVSRLLMQGVKPFEILIVEEDCKEQIQISRFAKDERIRKIFVRSGMTPFNKCIAINVGVINAKYNKILMNDVDIILPKNYVAEIDKILDGYETAFIAKVIYNVILNQSSVVWTGNKRVDYFSGGSIAFTRDGFEKIGGMCERFYGYGSEDCEFWQRVKEATKLYENRQKNLLHVNHKKIANFSINGQLFDDLNKLTMSERIDACRKNLQERKIGTRL